MFMYTNSGQNKLKVIEKEKKTYFNLYERNLSCGKAIHIHLQQQQSFSLKNDIHILNSLLTLPIPIPDEKKK